MFWLCVLDCKKKQFGFLTQPNILKIGVNMKSQEIIAFNTRKNF